MTITAEPINVFGNQIDSTRIQYVYCSGCKSKVTPEVDKPNFGHECPTGTDLFQELDYQMGYGLVHCDACGQGTYPDLGETHTCPHAS